MPSSESATPSNPCPPADPAPPPSSPLAPRRDWITLEHPLELEAAPDFDPLPPRASMDAMLELSEQIRIQRAKDGLPLRQFDPVPVEFVL